MNQHAETIGELKRSVAVWKKKYQAAKGVVSDETATCAELPAFTDTEVEMLKELEKVEDGPAHTVAIDMRDALKEARRSRARVET
ncbi:MAG: hypothetical protein R3305_03120, partial [Gammaproteobacteria bacterium]|nr:hypothetical protein [Gammaproteobacteria bacterium]